MNHQQAEADDLMTQEVEERRKRAEAAGCPVLNFDYTTPRPEIGRA